MWVTGAGTESHDWSTNAARCFYNVSKGFSRGGTKVGIWVSHVVGSGERCQGDSGSVCLVFDSFRQPVRKLFRQGGNTCRGQVELHSAISVCRRGGEHLGRVGEGVGTGKDRWKH